MKDRQDWGRAPFIVRKADGTQTTIIVNGRERWALTRLMEAGKRAAPRSTRPARVGAPTSSICAAWA